MNAEFVLRILTALGGCTAIVMLLRIRQEKRKLRAETKKTEIDANAVMTGTVLSLIQPLREENEKLRIDLTNCTRDVALLRAQIKKGSQADEST